MVGMEILINVYKIVQLLIHQLQLLLKFVNQRVLIVHIAKTTHVNLNVNMVMLTINYTAVHLVALLIYLQIH